LTEQSCILVTLMVLLESGELVDKASKKE
jgi:hypothetical protein